MDFKKMACEAVDWIYLIQERCNRRVLVNAIINLQVP
jgi:hypothetical protein